MPERNVELPIATWLQQQTQPDVLALGLQPVLPSVVGEAVADSPAMSRLKPGDWVTGVNERKYSVMARAGRNC